MGYFNEWEFKNIADIPFAITNEIKRVFEEQVPHHVECCPFKSGFIAILTIEGNLFCLQLRETNSNIIEEVAEPEFIEVYRKLLITNSYPDYQSCFQELNSNGFRYDYFTYIGKIFEQKLSWPHIFENVIAWINDIVLPRITELNARRVVEAIPKPPSYDTEFILSNIYVLESEEGMKQGTAFHLKDVGLVTCDHCIRDDSSRELLNDVVIFKGNKHSNRYPIEILNTNEAFDVAIIKCSDSILGDGFELRSADTVELLHHISVAGFPNYNYGDNGIFSPGLVVGFRMLSGIRHLLINSPLISGNSGGPILDRDGKVVGIAVTGADKMSEAHETEKHGVIPIDVINLL